MAKTTATSSNGVVYWVTGMSASGKSTISAALASALRAPHSVVVLLDGDELREVFGGDLGHSEADRRKSAMRNARLCKMLSEQGLTVVCATISLFHEVQAWNRGNIPGYREVFITAPIEVLKKRDPKKIYEQSAKGNIVGLDIPAEFPKNPHLTIVNDGSHTPAQIATHILQHFKADRRLNAA